MWKKRRSNLMQARRARVSLQGWKRGPKAVSHFRFSVVVRPLLERNVSALFELFVIVGLEYPQCALWEKHRRHTSKDWLIIHRGISRIDNYLRSVESHHRPVYVHFPNHPSQHHQTCPNPNAIASSRSHKYKRRRKTTVSPNTHESAKPPPNTPTSSSSKSAICATQHSKTSGNTSRTRVSSSARQKLWPKH